MLAFSPSLARHGWQFITGNIHTDEWWAFRSLAPKKGYLKAFEYLPKVIRRERESNVAMPVRPTEKVSVELSEPK